MARCRRQCITQANFPEWKKRDHIGHSYAGCPYDTATPELRVRLMLKDTISGAGGHDVMERDPITNDFIYDIDDEILTYLGFSRNLHVTVSGNREDDNDYGATEYLRNPTFSGSVYMSTASPRGAWGFVCSFNNCAYRQNNNGKRYFYF